MDKEAHIQGLHYLGHPLPALMYKGLMGLHPLLASLHLGAHLHHLLPPLQITLIIELHHHPTSRGQEAHLHFITLGIMDLHLTCQEDLVISLKMVETPIIREWRSPRYPHKGLLLGDHHQTTLMDEEDLLVLQVKYQDSGFHLQTSSVVHLNTGDHLRNHGEIRLKTLKGTGDHQFSSLVAREVHHQGIMIRKLLASQHDLTTMMIAQVMLEMLDLFVDLCFQHHLKVRSQYRIV